MFGVGALVRSRKKFIFCNNQISNGETFLWCEKHEKKKAKTENRKTVPHREERKTQIHENWENVRRPSFFS